jgi:hypothetical protein
LFKKVSSAARVYKGGFIVIKQGWGTTIIKYFAIILRCCPQRYIPVDLGSSHVVCLGGLTLVSILGIHEN